MRYMKRHKFLSVVLIILSVYVYINYTRIIPVNDKIDKDNPAYVNDIYMSDERIYNNHLNETEQQAYREMMDMFRKREKVRDIDLSKYPALPTSEISHTFMKVREAVMIDHPEMLQFSSASTSYTDTYLKLKLDFAINNPLMESINTLRIRRMIDNIRLETKDMNDLEKIKYVYEWIGDNSTYDTLFTYQSKNQSIYNVFIKENAVCAGFAKASQVIFQNIGIESTTVSGYSTGPHMWNIIKYEDKYYYYDSTYAASINDKSNSHYYGGLKQEELNFYRPDYPDWYPKVETTNKLLEEK